MGVLTCMYYIDGIEHHLSVSLDGVPILHLGYRCFCTVLCDLTLNALNLRGKLRGCKNLQ